MLGGQKHLDSIVFILTLICTNYCTDTSHKHLTGFESNFKMFPDLSQGHSPLLSGQAFLTAGWSPLSDHRIQGKSPFEAAGNKMTCSKCLTMCCLLDCQPISASQCLFLHGGNFHLPVRPHLLDTQALAGWHGRDCCCQKLRLCM